MTQRLAIVGGGITGLAAAWFARRVLPDVDVTLFEASAQLGGKLRTEELAGLALETGADAFLTREPHAEELVHDVGLGDALIEPGERGVTIWSRGRAHPMPRGLVLGAPTRFRPLFGSSLISTSGALRALLDLVVPGEVEVDHESVAQLVSHRFGEEVLDRLVAPLLSGIHAGDPDRLGAAAATPRLADAVRDGRSLARGLRRTVERPDDDPRFRTVRGGLSRLVERLAEDLDARRSSPVRLLAPAGDGYRLALATGPDVSADAVVLAVPAFAAGALLRDVAPEVSGALREIPYVSVAVVTLVLPEGSLELEGSGMLVAADEDRVVKAVTYVSNKWPHLVPDGRVVLRASVGRRDREEPLDWDDDRLVGAVADELRELVGLGSAPEAARVTRWERALPQYEPRHLDRVARIEAGTRQLPRIALAGAGYRGIGIAACVEDAQRAVDRVAASLSSVPA